MKFNKFKILTYIGFIFLLILFFYLLSKVFGLVYSLTLDQLILGFIGGQLYFNWVLERRLSNLEGEFRILGKDVAFIKKKLNFVK